MRPPRLRSLLRCHPAGWAGLAARPLTWKLAGLGLLVLLPQLGHAQPAEVMGPGLRGDYYEGLNFEHLVQTRRDARLDFDWHERSPLPGVPATYFTVRWTGWLVPPVTGHYVLHLTVDDGVRLWLNNRQLLAEWRGQPLGSYHAAVDLQAGQTYPLRLEYCQYSATSRLLFSWERPRQPEALASWRTLWGLTTHPLASNHYREVVPTRSLVNRWPPAPQPLRRPLVGPPSVAKPPAKPVTTPVSLKKISPLPVRARVRSNPDPPAPPVIPLAAPLANLNALAKGTTLPLERLYFVQSTALLRVDSRRELERLVTRLRNAPAVRLEIAGHTDNVGDSTKNVQLSQQRATVVRAYLVEHGIDSTRVTARGYGGTRPVADHRDPVQRPRNRRVEVIIR